MSKRVLVLVEGQTEERFVKDVLASAFLKKELFLFPTLLVTKRVKNGPNFKGGVTNFAKFKNDVNRLLKSAGNALVTTLLDYNGLPSDFPGMDNRPSGIPIQRVTHVESAIAEYFECPPNFLPFLALHEFEALLFSSSTELPRVMIETRKTAKFAEISRCFHNPEEINEQPESSPSKRILKLFPAYRKVLHGPVVAQRIGLSSIRSTCPHFASWLSMLEQFSES